jgi:lysophospholipase L1-like esterase
LKRLLLLALAGAALAAAQGRFVPSDGAPAAITIAKWSPTAGGTCQTYSALHLNYTTGHIFGCVGTPPNTPVWVDLTATPKTLLGNGVCGFGDSLIGAGSSDIYFAPTWFNVAVVLSNGQWQFVHQAGVSGNTTTQMLARLSTDVLQQSCSKVVIDGGTNDIAGGTAMTQIQANLQAIYLAILANGQLPIATTIPPKTGGFYAQTSTLNAWIRATAAKLNIPLVDVFALTVDPATGDYKSGYSSDGTHFSGASLRLVAQKAVADLASVFPAHHPLLPATNTDPNNLLSNGMLLNSASGIATGWSAINASGRVTWTVATDANVAGNVQVATKSTTNAGDNDALAAPDIASGYSAGDRIAVIGKIVTSGIESAAASAPPGINVYFYTSGFAYAGAFLAPWNLWTCDVPNGQFYLEAIVPANTAHIDLQLNFGNGTGTVKLGQLGVYNLTKMGL